MVWPDGAFRSALSGGARSRRRHRDRVRIGPPGGSRVDAQDHGLSQRKSVRVGIGTRAQLPLRPPAAFMTPQTREDFRTGYLPANAPDRMAQMGGAVTELEIGQTDHPHACEIG